MPDGVEAFGADDGQREDAGRDGQTLTEVDELAQRVTVHPVLVDLHRHAERHADADDHQVSDAEVDEERVGDGTHAAAARVHVDHQQVTDATDEERDAVQRDQHGRRRVLVHEEHVADAVEHVVRHPRLVVVRRVDERRVVRQRRRRVRRTQQRAARVLHQRGRVGPWSRRHRQQSCSPVRDHIRRHH